MARKYLPLVVAVLITLPALLGACCRTISPPRHVQYHASPLVKLRLHGDTNFTPLERSLIDQACRDLLMQTGGWYDVSVTWDFDMADTVEGLHEGHTLTRRTSLDLLIVMTDLKRGGQVLGITVQQSNQTFLVADRLDTPAKWRHVVMHELLHQAGLDDLYHARQYHSLMFWATSEAEPVTCMSKDDAIEMCRVLDCDAEKTNYCGS